MFESFAEASVGRRINMLFRLSMRHIRNEMKKRGVGTGDYVFMIMLFIRDGLSQDDLSRQMQVDKSYTARAVAKLEKMGLVRRRPDPDEHRIKRVFLTPKARGMEADLFRVFKGWHTTLVEDIDDHDLEILLAGMDKMIENARIYLGADASDINFYKEQP